MDQNGPWFVHESLDLTSQTQLRLLEVLLHEGPMIECTLKIYDELARIGYTCLSYVWGPEESEESMQVILINNARWRVRKNLGDFLAVFKTRAVLSDGVRGVKLWIDAICIDQDHILEKNAQVQRMGEIYRDSQQVISWLGVSNTQPELIGIVNELRSELMRVRQLPPKQFEMTKRILNKDYRFYDAPQVEIDLIIDAASNEYWDRAWIVQEVLLASNSIFWSRTGELFTFGRLREMVDICFAMSYSSAVTPHHETLRSLLKAKLVREGRNLFDLLADHRNKKCSNSAYRIYSLLALTNDKIQLTVDYSASNVDLFFRTLWACRSSFCICLGWDLMRALQILDQLHNHLSTLPSQSKPRNKPFVTATVQASKSMRAAENSSRRDTEYELRLDAKTVHCDFPPKCQCSNVNEIRSRFTLPSSHIIVCFASFLFGRPMGNDGHLLLERVGDRYHSLEFFTPFDGVFGRSVERKSLCGIYMTAENMDTTRMDFTLSAHLRLALELARERHHILDITCRHQFVDTTTINYEYMP